MRVLGELEGVVGPVERALEVGQHHVDPAGVLLYAAGPAAAFDHGVRMLGLQCPERPQSVAVDIRARIPASGDPVRQRRLGEAGHRIDRRVPWTTVFSGLRKNGSRF